MYRDYQKLVFHHFVIVTSYGTIFGCAKENGHTCNFLIRQDSVRGQDRGQWIELAPELAQLIRCRAQEAYARVPTYRTSRLVME